MKKLNNIKWFTLGIVVCIVMSQLLVPAFAATITKQATLLYNDIKITLNGTAVTPKDANGAVVEPFAIDGTTYLPVRAISDALGMEVGWDQATSTVKLTGSGGDGSGDVGQYVKVYEAYNNLKDIYDPLLLNTYNNLQGCMLTYLDSSIPLDSFTSVYNSVKESIKSGGYIENQISAAKEAVNALSGDRWVSGEITLLKLHLDKMISILGYMRRELDAIEKISSNGASTNDFWSNSSTVYLGLSTLSRDINNGMSSALNKIISASAG